VLQIGLFALPTAPFLKGGGFSMEGDFGLGLFDLIVDFIGQGNGGLLGVVLWPILPCSPTPRLLLFYDI